MGGKSKPQTTTTIQKNEPLPAQVPYLTDMWATGSELRKNGSPAYFPDSTVVDWSKQTQDAVDWQESIARNPAFAAIFQNAQNTANRVMTEGAPASAQSTWNSIQNGAQVGTNPFLSLFQKMADGSANWTNDAAHKAAAGWTNPGVGATQGAIGTIGATDTLDRLREAGGYTNDALGGQKALSDKLAGGENEALAYLRKSADGSYLDGGNPYLTGYIENALSPLHDQFKNATAQNNSSFAASGRFGSRAFADSINSANKNYSDSVAKTATDLAYQNYNAERDRQLAAQTQLGNFYNTDVANQRGALSDLAGTSSNQQSLRNSALTSAAGAEQSEAQLRLSGADQLGRQSLAQEQHRLSANEALRDQFNRDRSTELQAGQAGAATAQNDIQNVLSQLNIKLNAANAQAGDSLNRNGQALQAANSASSIYDSLFKPVDKLKEVGTANEQQTGAYLQDAINRWNHNENIEWENLERELNLHRGLGYGTSTGTQTQQVHSNKGAQALGTAASVVGALAKCDRRLKTDVHAIGTTFSGLPLYAFRYVDEERWHFGPMAQEVAAVVPSAVGILEDGEHLGINAPALILFENLNGSKAVH